MMGRSLRVARCAGRHVARFSFEELCNRNLGAADYIAVAKRFANVIVADVPLLYFDQREVIRRFITLLDVLYEYRTRLILSAAARPQELFLPARSALEPLAGHASAGPPHALASTSPASPLTGSSLGGGDHQASPGASAGVGAAVPAGAGAGRHPHAPGPKLVVHGGALGMREDEKFASSRAVSRLVEMSSVEYLRNARCADQK